MKVASLPVNESERLRILEELRILDTGLEESYDELTRLVAKICEVPISLVSLVDDRRQWFKSRVGLDVPETPREVAFCAHAILNSDTIMEIPDARLDERFHDNPFVAAENGIVFYAGAPLVVGGDCAVGTLCVIDTKPRQLSPLQREALSVLSRQVSNQLELRRNLFTIADAKNKTAAMALVVTYNHELNNPLTIMKGQVELLKKHLPAGQTDKIEEQIERMVTVLQAIHATLRDNGFQLEDYTGDEAKMLKLSRTAAKS